MIIKRVYCKLLYAGSLLEIYQLFTLFPASQDLENGSYGKAVLFFSNDGSSLIKQWSFSSMGGLAC